MPSLATEIRRPHLTEDIMPFSECRNNLAGCFSRVRETHRPLIVTQNGRASTVLISAEDFDPLMDVFLLSRTVRLRPMPKIASLSAKSESGSASTITPRAVTTSTSSVTAASSAIPRGAGASPRDSRRATSRCPAKGCDPERSA